MFIELLTVTGFVPPFLSNSTRNRLGYGFFVVTNGPLAASIIMNSNTLVLHDIVKTSGVFIHWNPALVSFALRWRLMWTQGGSWAPFNHHGGFFASESDAQHEPKVRVGEGWVAVGCGAGQRSEGGGTERNSVGKQTDYFCPSPPSRVCLWGACATTNQRILRLEARFARRIARLIANKYCLTSPP